MGSVVSVGGEGGAELHVSAHLSVETCELCIPGPVGEGGNRTQGLSLKLRSPPRCQGATDHGVFSSASISAARLIEQDAR
uniref:Uncharacterized protein n=1 Tax=Knipowitschia caucasica TaxID=637954 RepID=A0AAV2J074_KNICA